LTHKTDQLENHKGIRLSELAGEIRHLFQNAFGEKTYWVIADISNYSFYSQKSHHYFDLVEKDEKGVSILAKMPAAAWYSGNESIRRFERCTGQRFKEDIRVLVKVSVDFHPVYGIKLVLQDVDVNYTLGRIEKQKQETIQTLISEGFISVIGDRYITDNNRLSLPKVIQRVAVVSAAGSAGLQDFEHTLESNQFGYRFWIDTYHTVVQGENNASVFYDKIIEVFTSGVPYDVLVIIRGGGSQSDFLLFDQYLIGKLIAKFPIPVITGIGHQKNETIADLVAHTSVKTPTKAAEFIIAQNRTYEDAMISFEKSIVIQSQQLLAMHKEFLAEAKSKMIERSKAIIYDRQTELNEMSNSLQNFCRYYFRQEGTKLNSMIGLVNAFSPLNILRKGFAIVKMNDKIEVDTDKINIGDKVLLIMHGTEFKASIESKKKYDGSEYNV
jgi:exodeoxyribonuclease VII large subunit